jgi:formylglycine-generating enzyme required for sulfatase activity
VNFYVAYAFCIWDGGRLPTEAEWNYAAAGGKQQRVYPWSVESDQGLDGDHAFFGQTPQDMPIDVGSKPKGDGRWGQSDLSGNLAEWTLDYYSSQYPSTVCNDCVNETPQSTRVVRGGAYLFNAKSQQVGYRTSAVPESGWPYIGFRCVRDLSITTPH